MGVIVLQNKRVPIAGSVCAGVFSCITVLAFLELLKETWLV